MKTLKKIVGVVVVSHGNIAIEMIRTTRSIVTNALPIAGVSLKHDEETTQMREKIRNAIREVDQDAGILLLSDMFGGTPSNVCLSFLEKNKVEVITGFNLPMLIKLASYREGQSLSEIALFIKDYGQKNIALAGQVLGVS